DRRGPEQDPGLPRGALPDGRARDPSASPAGQPPAAGPPGVDRRPLRSGARAPALDRAEDGEILLDRCPRSRGPADDRDPLEARHDVLGRRRPYWILLAAREPPRGRPRSCARVRTDGPEPGASRG